MGLAPWEELMTTSKERILSTLRAAQQPFAGIDPEESLLPVVPLADTSPGALLSHFVASAEKLASQVYQPASPQQALDTVAGLLEGDGQALAWDFAHIPLPGLEELLKPRMLRPDQPQSDARIGITGADAALAATGSLVLMSGPGKPRAASLLPPVHVAILERSRIVPDLESWFALQRQAGLDRWRAASHAIVISGPSRTADIAMTLIMGMHGPAELHIVIV
jgi:L-lactate dehydrogenase complex protein LldG